MKVTASPTTEFVFDESYNLPKLEDFEKHIREKKHLPEIAPAKIMEKERRKCGSIPDQALTENRRINSLFYRTK